MERRCRNPRLYGQDLPIGLPPCDVSAVGSLSRLAPSLMQIGPHLILQFVLSVLGPELLVASVGPPEAGKAPPPINNVRREASRLIAEDAKLLTRTDQQQSNSLAEEASEDVVTLEPMVVEGRKVPDLSVPPETEFEAFIRTGTIQGKGSGR